MKRLVITLLSLSSFLLFSQNNPPTIEISSLTVGATDLKINYLLKDNENNPCKIEVKVYSKKLGGFVPFNVDNATGDIGDNISPGVKQITLPYSFKTGNYVFDLVANDGQIVDINDLVKQVDKDKLKSNLSWLEGTRHRTAGVAHLQETKDSLIHLFNELNLDTITQTFKYLGYQGLNIIGNIHGVNNRQRIYINDAHYDSVAGGPGADDNASGVAGFMEIARVLSQYHFENSLRFIGFDLEEVGLNGSTAYVNKGISPNDSIQGVINYEMIGYYSEVNNSQTVPTGFNLLFPAEYAVLQADTFKGNFIANIGNVSSKPLSDAFIFAANQYVPELKLISLNLPGNGTIAPDFRRSDHANFWDKGYMALMLTDGADFRNKNYHTANDKVDILNMDFMSNNVKATLATLATLAKPISGDVASFDINNSVAVKDVIPGKLKLKPNPFRNELICSFEGIAPATGMNVYNTEGRMIYYQKLNSLEKEFSIQTGNWNAGNYFLIVNTANGSYSAKVIKE